MAVSSRGPLCLGAGYWIAVTTESPMEAISYFFVAVVLVMAGTYCLFVAVSVAALKMLRRWKSFYYKTSHFTAVSGMIYRIKQNAVGLANICILSTGVLLMVSTTICLYVGREEIIAGRYPQEVNLTAYRADDESFQKIEEIEAQTLEEWGLTPINSMFCRSAQVAVLDTGDEMKILSGDDNPAKTWEKLPGLLLYRLRIIMPVWERTVSLSRARRCFSPTRKRRMAARN